AAEPYRGVREQRKSEGGQWERPERGEETERVRRRELLRVDEVRDGRVFRRTPQQREDLQQERHDDEPHQAVDEREHGEEPGPAAAGEAGMNGAGFSAIAGSGYVERCRPRQARDYARSGATGASLRPFPSSGAMAGASIEATTSAVVAGGFLARFPSRPARLR